MDNVREILGGAMSLVSWKTLALLLAVLNLKSVPLGWHVSVINNPGSVKIGFWAHTENGRLFPDKLHN